MIPKLRRRRILSRKEGSWRLGPQGVSIHVRQWRQFNASSNYRMLCATHCDLGYTIREKPFLLGIHEARVPQPWRPNCRLLSRGAHSSSAGVSSWTSAAARHIPHYGASYVSSALSMIGILRSCFCQLRAGPASGRQARTAAAPVRGNHLANEFHMMNVIV